MSSQLSKSIKVALLGAGLCLMVSVQAAQPSKASVEKLAEVMQMDHTLDQMFHNDFSANATGQMVRKMLPKDKKLTAEQRQEIESTVVEFQKQTMDAINTPEVRKQVIEAFTESCQKILTQEEVDAMLKFYDNPVGQSIIEKQPKLMQDYFNRFMPAMMQKEQEFIQKALPELSKKLAAIIGKENKEQKSEKSTD